MTFVSLVRGDFCKLRPFSLKARTALVPHSQRGWRGHLCTGGPQPSVSLPAGVSLYVHPTPEPAASNSPLVPTPCSTTWDPAQERCSHPPEQGTLSSPDPTPLCPQKGVSSTCLGGGPQVSSPLETLSPPSSHH